MCSSDLHDVVDYGALVQQAGLVLRPASTRGFVGLSLQDTVEGPSVAEAPDADTPAYRAGLDVGVVLTRVGGRPVRSTGEVVDLVTSARPGTRLEVEGVRRGERFTTSMDVAPDPHLELVPVERTGATLSEAQRRFRAAWLGSAVRDR